MSPLQMAEVGIPALRQAYTLYCTILYCTVGYLQPTTALVDRPHHIAPAVALGLLLELGLLLGLLLEPWGCVSMGPVVWEMPLCLNSIMVHCGQ